MKYILKNCTQSKKYKQNLLFMLFNMFFFIIIIITWRQLATSMKKLLGLPNYFASEASFHKNSPHLKSNQLSTVKHIAQKKKINK